MGHNLTIHKLFEDYTKNNPHHIAIINEDSLCTYHELNQKANQLAHYLKNFKLKNDSLIAISLDRSPSLLIGLLAILKAGSAYLPLDAEQPKHCLQYILDDSNTVILITDSKSKEKYAGYRGEIILIDQIWKDISTLPSSNLLLNIKSNHLAYAIYTSGTTGNPKGVLVEHKSVVNYLKWFYHYSGCKLQYRIDFSSNFIFDTAVTTTIAALACGLQIVICKEVIKKNVQQYLLYLDRYKINIIKLTPSYFKFLINEANSQTIALPNLSVIILGGEKLYAKECRAWLEMYPKHVLFNEYGPTETTVAVTQYKVTRYNITKIKNVVPIGKPGLNMYCKLLNHDGEIVTSGKLGELCIGGQCLARGYLHQEAASKQFILDCSSYLSQAKLYRTGDLCRYLPDGNIEFIERTDDQVKLRGYRIEPHEIEACLTSHHAVNQAIVSIRESPSKEMLLVGYIIPNDENIILDQQALREYLRQKLPEYMIPAVFIMMKAFPVNENDKLDKKALPEPNYHEEAVAPQTQLEQQLINIWKKIFHMENIGSDSHFFELGGHSLIATRMMLEIEKTLGKKIHLEDIYSAPTVGKLAVVLKSIENLSKNSLPINTIQKNTNIIPLSDFQFMFWVASIFEPKVKSLNIIGRRRLSGLVDISILQMALKTVLQRHEIFGYQISKWMPVQFLKKAVRFSLIETDLSSHPESEMELLLSASMDELRLHKKWHKKKPLIVVKLFHLLNERSEIQICVPHIVFDDTSEEVLFSELSTAYLHCQKGQQFVQLSEPLQYKNFVHYERSYLNKHLQRDIAFWQRYLQDTALLNIKQSDVIYNMKGIPYSTYLPLPTEAIQKMQKICSAASVSMTDVVCASVALALKRSVADHNNNIYMNIVRSVRENEMHDKLIGCFLRLDPIKVNINTSATLIELAKSIQQSRIETEPFQACSGMVKFACLVKHYRAKFIKNIIIHLLVDIYCFLCIKSQLNPTMLKMYGRLNILRSKHKFLVYINLLNNFIAPKQDKSLFGLDLQKVKTHKYNSTDIDNTLDISIFKNVSMDIDYLVISGNLKESFRQKMGDDMINIFSDL